VWVGLSLWWCSVGDVGGGRWTISLVVVGGGSAGGAGWTVCGGAGLTVCGDWCRIRGGRQHPTSLPFVQV